jgi:hypothetical protein
MDEDRIERLEARLAELESKAEGDPGRRLDRLLKYLPLLFAANLLVGGPALVIALVTAYATFTQAEATTKIQQAEAWPFLSYGTNNEGEAGEREISLVLSNDGIGPALLGPVEISYEGRAVRTPHELLERCCGYRRGSGATFTTSASSGISIRPGGSVRFLRLPASARSEQLWTTFDRERWKLQVRACYCSIFGDCWVVRGMQAQPRLVDQCPTNWAVYSQGTPAP